jgi:uncharacterized protein (UPF0276 family)
LNSDHSQNSQFGLGLRSSHFPEVLKHLGVNKLKLWFEAISENYMDVGGYPIQVLDKIRQNYELAFHGVGMSIASPEPIDINYLKSLKKLVDRFEPFIVSDHLSWTRFADWSSHDLLPFNYNEKNLNNMTEKILFVQDFLQRPLAFENPSIYLDLPGHEMPEADFIQQLSKKTSCQLLLDVNNLVVNKHNVGLDIHNYLLKIKNCNVVQFHIAGHSIQESIITTVTGPVTEVIRIDTHDHHPCGEAIEYLAVVRKMWPNARPMLEWDDKIPAWHEILVIKDQIDHLTQMQDGKNHNTNNHQNERSSEYGI